LKINLFLVDPHLDKPDGRILSSFSTSENVLDQEIQPRRLSRLSKYEKKNPLKIIS
jgi:hypothetical protein